MYGFCYSYSYGMPATFDPDSAMPCLDLAVQSLGETFKGDDGKYYQADSIGDRDGEILGGGVANFDGLRSVTFISDTTGFVSVNLELHVKTTDTKFVLLYQNLLVNNFVLAAQKGSSSAGGWGATVSPGIQVYIDDTVIYQNTTRDDIFDMLCDGDTHVVSIQNLDLTNWSSLSLGKYTGFEFTGNISYFSSANVGKYYFNAGSGAIVFDISDNGNHLQLATGSDVGFQTFEAGTYSYLDNYGYNKLGEAYLPALESNKTVDVFGGALANKGRVKYPVELWSSCLSTDGVSNYLDTGYYPNVDTVFIFKGSFDVIRINNYIGCGDTTNNKRLYFGITDQASGDNFVFGAGSFTTSDYPYDLEPHTFIVCATGEFFVLPINTDISTPVKIKDILDNTTPNGVGSGFTEASIETIYLGGLSALNYFAYTTNFEAQILEYDGTDITLIDKWGFSEYNGGVVYSLVGGVDLEILGSSVDIWDLSPYAYPRNNTLGYNKVGDAYIPASEIDPTKDVKGDDLLISGTKTGLNGSETKYKDPYVFELIQACIALSPNFRFDSTDSLLWGYEDIDGNIDDFIFSDTVTNAPAKDKVTTYSEPLTGNCLIKANEYFKTI